MTSTEALRRHGPVAAAIGVAAIHFASFEFRTLPIVTDIKLYLYFAWRMTEGAVPHLDYFDNKTQLAAFAGTAFYGLGDWFGADPLMAIRAGYLGIAALGGVLVFSIHRRMAGDDAVAGMLGLLAYCSFGLLGLMPAVGPIPKLLMAVCASGMALMVGRRRWFLAGMLGSLAFMDWQVGALAWLAAFAAAIVFGRRRLRASLRVIAGGAAGAGPFFLGYAVRGALGETFEQVVGSALFRGSSSMAADGLAGRLDSMGQLVYLACPEQEWLFFAGGAGLAVALWWMWRPDRPEQRLLLFPLVVYHFGLIAFSLTDFQWYGDFFALLHSVAFLLGLFWVALYRFAARLAERREAPRSARVAIVAVALLIATALARPSALRPSLELRAPTAAPGATLADQRAVARELESRIGGRRVVFLEYVELLFLMPIRQPVPFIYWNSAAWFRYREPGEDAMSTLRRNVLATDPECLVSDGRPYEVLGFGAAASIPIESDNGRYRVFLSCDRRTTGSTERPVRPLARREFRNSFRGPSEVGQPSEPPFEQPHPKSAALRTRGR